MLKTQDDRIKFYEEQYRRKYAPPTSQEGFQQKENDLVMSGAAANQYYRGKPDYVSFDPK